MDPSVGIHGGYRLVAAGPGNPFRRRVFRQDGRAEGEGDIGGQIHLGPVQGNALHRDGFQMPVYGTDGNAGITARTGHGTIVTAVRTERIIAVDAADLCVVRIVLKESCGPVQRVTVQIIVGNIAGERQENAVVVGQTDDFEAGDAVDRFILPLVTVVIPGVEQFLHFGVGGYPPIAAQLHVGDIIFRVQQVLVVDRTVLAVVVVFGEIARIRVVPFVGAGIEQGFRLGLTPGIVVAVLLRFGGAQVERSPLDREAQVDGGRGGDGRGGILDGDLAGGRLAIHGRDRNRGRTERNGVDVSPGIHGHYRFVAAAPGEELVRRVLGQDFLEQTERQTGVKG